MTELYILLCLVSVSDILFDLGFKCGTLDGISDHDAVLVHLDVNSLTPKQRFTYCTTFGLGRADNVSITGTLVDNSDISCHSLTCLVLMVLSNILVFNEIMHRSPCSFKNKEVKS